MSCTLLLTGSTGFVGRNILLRSLKDETYSKIILPVRSEEKLKTQLKNENISNIENRISIIETSGPLWKGLEGFKPDHLIHSAGLIAGQTYEEYRVANVESTVNLLEILPPTTRSLLLSSMAASGPCSKEMAEKSEVDSESPVTLYGKSKLEMEKIVTSKFKNHDYLFLRPPLIFGPRDAASLPLLQMAKGFIQFKPGFNTKSYSFIAVQDLVEAIFLALKSPKTFKMLPSRTYFVAYKNPIIDVEMIGGATGVFNKGPRIINVPQPILKLVSAGVNAITPLRKAIPTLSKDKAKEIWPDRWVIDPSAFEKEFNWKAEINYSTAIKDTYLWYKSQNLI